MLKLLLPHQEKSIKKIYILRYLTFVLYGATIILFYYAITFIPSFVATQQQRSLLKEQITVVQDPLRNQDKVLLNERVNDAVQTLRLLDTQTYSITTFVAAITANQLPEITISSLEVEEKNNGKVVSVQGISADRESLQVFVERLRDEEIFLNVDLPFSSFTRGVDVPFSLTITAAPYQVDTSNTNN